ncbi:hypothetical protein [Nocardioides sp.]|uniref:hypothetical protein n=1 Tax=Nocardioides sp. TaxID=35761 RepID=UPI002628B8E9|nr:hypothetical protein [Nocardioides sp.]
MSTETCPACSASTATPDDVIDDRARYADTQGGHNDRHTLVLEQAEQAASTLTTEETR